MKAAVYLGDKTIEVSEIEKPVLTENGAIIKVHGCGLCGSDIVKFQQSLVSSGSVLGHEIVGEIVELKTQTQNFNIGDKVVAGHHVPCYECVYCKNENYSMCKEFKKTNIMPGGFSEYIMVSEAHLKNTVFKIPDNLSDIEASYTEPSACCLRAVKRAIVKQNDNVLVIGLGSIGLIIGQIAKYYGAKVFGCDLKDERLDLARELGFDKTYKFTNKDDTKKNILEKNNIGVDKVFLAAGNSKSVEFVLSCIRDGGTTVVFSSIPSELGFNNNEIYYRELTVMGSYSPSPRDLGESLNLINNGTIRVDFAKIYNLDEINQAIEDTLSNKILKAYIKI